MTETQKINWYERFLESGKEEEKARGLLSKIGDPRSKVRNGSDKEIQDYVRKNQESYYPNAPITQDLSEENLGEYQERLKTIAGGVIGEANDVLHGNIDDIVEEMGRSNKGALEQLIAMHSKDNPTISLNKKTQDKDMKVLGAYNGVREAKEFKSRYESDSLGEEEGKQLMKMTAQEYAKDSIEGIKAKYKEKTGVDMSKTEIAKAMERLATTVLRGYLKAEDVKKYQDKSVKARIEYIEKAYKEVEANNGRTIYDIAKDSIKGFVNGNAKEFEHMKEVLYSLKAKNQDN